MFFALGSIAGAGMAALGTFKKTLISGGEKAPTKFHVSMKIGSDNVTIVSPRPLEVIGPQFNFKFVDTAYNLTANHSLSSTPPLSITLRNQTFEAALYPSKVHFIPDSDPPTAEAQMLVFIHPSLAEGTYNFTVNEFQWGNSPITATHFDVPVEFSFDPKAREDAAAHEEL